MKFWDRIQGTSNVMNNLLTDIPHDAEKCQNCGVRYLFVYWVADEVWPYITPKPENLEAGLLCPICADTRARRVGIELEWYAVPAAIPEPESTNSQGTLCFFCDEYHYGLPCPKGTVTNDI